MHLSNVLTRYNTFPVRVRGAVLAQKACVGAPGHVVADGNQEAIHRDR